MTSGMTPPVTCRPWRPGDRAACFALFDSNVPDFFHEDERAEFEAFLDDLPGPYVVLERAGEIVACGGYALRVGDLDGEPSARAGRIADLCWAMVRRDLHGLGLGRALTERRVTLALEDAAVEELALVTSQHTVGFYERLGFTTVSVEPDGFAPGLDRCTMRRRLTGG
jgi:ribosomal protein S18 acetylase RimI-like enzyme